MGFWKTAKFAVTTALDYIEERPARKQYKLHPDSAYLGNKYYSTETQLPVSAGSLTSSTSSSSASAALPPLGGSPRILRKKEEQPTGIMQPHVHIGIKPVQTPMRLPEAKYTVLRQKDLVDDDKIDSMVGRDRNLYWVIKGAVVLMVKERIVSVTSPPRKTQKKTSKESMTEVSDATDGGKARINPLKSPSVEDFFAGTFAAGNYSPIETLPPNPLVKDSRAAPQLLNPLDGISWSEMVIVFRRDTKELFVRKQDGKLYPVIWKVRTIHSRLRKDDGSSQAIGGVKYTSVEGGVFDDEDYVDVELV